mmetsp:Transcript_1324/g.5548  ORF Transcript_1324/g.5548 Transcript_1324/m.5548 type:complete len:429 (-) Transcript_1324:940-2226(-)
MIVYVSTRVPSTHRASDADSAFCESALETRRVRLAKVSSGFGSSASSLAFSSLASPAPAPSYASSSHPLTNSFPSSSQDFTETECARLSFSPTADAAFKRLAPTAAAVASRSPPFRTSRPSRSARVFPAEVSTSGTSPSATCSRTGCTSATSPTSSSTAPRAAFTPAPQKNLRQPARSSEASANAFAASARRRAASADFAVPGPGNDGNRSRPAATGAEAMIFFRRSLRSVASAASRISALPRRTVTLAPLASRRVTRSRSRSRANDSNAPDPFGKPETPKTARDAFSESASSFSFVFFLSFASFESPSKTPAPSRRNFSSSFSFASSSFAKSSVKESSQNASSAPGASQGVEGAFAASAKPLSSVSAAATSAKTTRFSARYCRVSCSMRCKISGRCSVNETPPVGGFKRTCIVCGENRWMRDATCAS